MAKMILIQKVTDYNHWKSVFDSMKPVRNSYGSTGAKVFRADNEPNEIIVVSDWRSIDQAKKYSQSQELKDALKKGGANGSSNFYFVD
jgi:heme-degrading monooxygenase HmoA